MDLLPVLPTSAARGTRRWRRPVCVCAGAIVMVALIVSIASLAPAASPSFPDVPAGHPYEAAITDLASRGIIGGYGAPTYNFGLLDSVKRAQFAKMIVGTLGIPPNASTLPASPI